MLILQVPKKKDVRSRQELREAGENKLFNDEMEYITEGLGKRQPLNVQRIRYWKIKFMVVIILFIFANYNNMRITANHNSNYYNNCNLSSTTVQLLLQGNYLNLNLFRGLSHTIGFHGYTMPSDVTKIR